MATLLVNPKIHPALAARVETSVTGRRRQALTTRSFVRLVALLRVGAILAVAALVTLFIVSRQRERTELSRARATLFEHWKSEAASLQASDFEFLERTAKILAGFTSEYPGDFVASELRSSGAFAAVLARPAIYVRGPLAAFGNSTGSAKAASESGKDALLLCLRDPPASRVEKLLLPKARLALGGGAPVQELTPNVRRLHEAQVGMQFLQPQWGERVQNAKDQPTLLRLERELKKAPIAAAKAVLQSNLLIAVLDEPNEGGGVTELDGEHAHSIRLVVAELPSAKVLVRLRKRVDPEWITPNRRSQYARELDGCKLAVEVHEAVQAPESSAPGKPVEAAQRLGDLR